MKDLIIIGGGAAGLSAAVYASNACMDFAVIEKYPLCGGQLLNTTEINNYAGFDCIGGFELSEAFRKHAEKSGAVLVNDEVEEISKAGGIFSVRCHNADFEARAVIFAAGAASKQLGVKGEKELAGRGVSYCATCDGNFFRNRTVAVAGGGDVACEDALYLANICEKVYLIHRRDTLRGAKYLQKRIFAEDKIQFVPNANITEISGGGRVESVTLDTGEVLDVSGVFIAVGIKAETNLVKGLVELSGDGFVVAGESCQTSLEGFYAAGDIRTKPLRQIATAVADGANAVKSVEAYFNK